MTRRPLDAELVRRGLASSRAEAQEAVLAGLVTVRGAPAWKPATMVAADEPVGVAAPARRFVSRGGAKLAAALERFDVDPAGRNCLDAGASTGGFTHRLLRGGAARVATVDVGYGQLAWQLRTDPRVVVLERTNVRNLGRGSLPFDPDLMVADLSFISLRLVANALIEVATADADLVMLVKPQFEARAADVGSGGVVRDPDVWRRALDGVVARFADAGAPTLGMMASPLPGPAGNVEFFVHARKGGAVGHVDPSSAIEEGKRLS
ncbi:MAG: TlyA family RNA methyltransferase [Actinomycetota bacterium]|nr:TlyA family RNA methyltransferase [Actinomycetota bacterium]